MSKPAARFGALSSRLPDQPTVKPEPAEPQVVAASAPPADRPASSGRTKGREGKRAIAGYFSGELSRQLRTLAAAEETTVQALMGEAFDLLMRNRGKHPFNER